MRQQGLGASALNSKNTLFCKKSRLCLELLLKSAQKINEPQVACYILLEIKGKILPLEFNHTYILLKLDFLHTLVSIRYFAYFSRE